MTQSAVSVPDPTPTGAWYVVHAKPRQEWRALQNLLNQGYQAWLPGFTEWRKRAGHWQRLSSPMFPRYLLMRPASEHQSIGPVRSTIGVSALVHFGGEPARMPGGVVAALRQLERQLAEQPAPDASPFSSGMAVRISDGPLSGLDGIIAHAARDRVTVLLSLLGREKEVALAPDMLAFA